ncbi:MAG: hypothetical protein RLZ97_1827 [Verrucomicrobiota bacterium]
MISGPLAFQRDRHWRELSPAEGRRRWRFEYLAEVPHRLDTSLRLTAELCDKHGRPWVRLEGRWWITLPGYQWNGCSPKRHLPLLGWIGTPDIIGGRNGACGNLIASGWHDQARQFSRTALIADRFTIPQIDLGFRHLLREVHFPRADLYHRAVALAAPLWPHQEDGQHSRILRLDP